MLPNSASAIVEPGKVRDYLLSPSHPLGRFKRKVFTALGYTENDWVRLCDDLLAHGRSGRARLADVSCFGQKYVVSGNLSGPSGRTGRFVTVWLVESEGSAPRFITAYPE